MMLDLTKATQYFRCCVRNAINENKHLGTYEDLKSLGCLKKLDGRSFRHLKRSVKGDARLSVTKVVSNLNAILPKPVTMPTAHIYLKELGFEYVLKIEKQWLDIQHRQQQVAWCAKHIN